MKARAQRAGRPTSPKTTGLPAGKSREVVGILLALAALLLLAALVSHQPADPSSLSRSTDAVAARNWIGPVGAQISAWALSFVGIAALVVPLFLAVAAWRRLRPSKPPKVIGRGVGIIMVVVALPALLHLVLTGGVEWRQETLKAGGFLGQLLADQISGRIGFVGCLFLLLGAVVIGSTLIVQSSLGELLTSGTARLRALRGGATLRRSRLRKRKQKDLSRQRVLEKHYRRGGPARSASGAGGRSAEDESRPEPARVVERRGEGSFSVRRVTPSAARSTEMAKSVRSPVRKQQKALPFAAEVSRSSALPPLNLLSLDEEAQALDESQLMHMGELIVRRCREFGVEGTIEGIGPGPVITVFEFQPAPGVKVSQILNLQNDLALALKAESVRIDRMPGRSTLGIEVPNDERRTIRLGPLFAEEEFRKSPSVLTMALGRDLQGRPYYADLASMPHVLVAGATGAGKSVGLQSMITSILYKARRDEVQFIFIDPKRIELGVYSQIPHLKTEVVVEPKKAANALRWAVGEMERRYRLLAEIHVRSIAYYNRAILDPKVQERLALRDQEGQDDVQRDLEPLPYLVLVIDELADLMMVASSEVETSIARLAQMARAVGIHLIVATQRPSVDVLTGTIKANFPCRLSYATASRHDSRTILDQVGAEKLLGRGDMLFMPPGTARVMRLHGALISEQETAALVRWLRKQGKPDLDPEILKPPADERGRGEAGQRDEVLFDEAARLVVAERQGSASFLQRRMRIGFSRAARLIDMMEQDGLLGPPQG
ncbi:MAG: DNA translocase FtsK, partial [Acidobacteria bacterium]|nr:DNA translocase FtsK [Acidobacteriota bacterium]